MGRRRRKSPRARRRCVRTPPGSLTQKGCLISSLPSKKTTGTGLASILSALAGVQSVVVTDYPSPSLLATISSNVQTNLPSAYLREKVKVQGHEWGELGDGFAIEYAGSFTRILCADCLWIEGQHESLVKSMRHFLAKGEGARVWVVAGFHTGRERIARFFGVVDKEDLEVEDVWECDVEGKERAWVARREGAEDVEERQRWLVVAVLKWR